jgi:dTDP-4-dehydrorhamnose 3,5-epimerase
MKFHATDLPGVTLIETEPVGDERGHFVRVFCARELAANGIEPALAQASQSFNAEKGTLRGLHFQAHPAMEDKLVRCLRGAIFDVMVDLRPGSPTFGRWIGFELTEANNLQLHAPKGFAHGFQTLAPDTIVSYHISAFYEPGRSAGVRFDDPQIGVRWPLPPVGLSARDLALPLLADIDASLLLPYGQTA